jgi:hypothetical protein
MKMTITGPYDPNRATGVEMQKMTQIAGAIVLAILVVAFASFAWQMKHTAPTPAVGFLMAAIALALAVGYLVFFPPKKATG